MTRIVAATWILALALPGCGRSGPSLQDQTRSIPELRSMLKSSDSTVQARGALGLQFHRSAATDAVPDLIAILDSPDSLVRQNASLALAAIGPEARDAVSALTKRLGDADWPVRRQAAIALGSIGQDASPALPALVKLEKDPVHHVALAAKEARKKIAR